MRDVQMSKVYAWQRTALPDFTTREPLRKPDVQILVYRVLADVRAAGGYAPKAPPVKFTKRAGGATGSWNQLNFTPGRTPLQLVLHEIAHALTWYPAALATSRAKANQNVPLTKDEQHVLDRFCDQGHGPRYVACYIALLERYADIDHEKLLRLARGFTMDVWGPWRLTGTSKGSDGRMLYHRSRTRVQKAASVAVDRNALAYWRNLLKKA